MIKSQFLPLSTVTTSEKKIIILLGANNDVTMTSTIFYPDVKLMYKNCMTIV